MSAAVNILHILVIVPILFWIYAQRGKLPKNFCNIGLIVVAFGFGYHLWMLKNLTDKTAWKSWIYVLHILVVFPLIAWVLWQCNAGARKWYEMLLLLAFSALGYHTYNLVKYWGQ